MRYGSIDEDDTEVFYRECDDPEKPAMLLLHGFPTSSHMFRDLMPMLEESFHLVAPDYPGFGQSESPPRDSFAYTFDHLSEVVEDFVDALGIDRFHMYVFDYGAPIGFRIAARHPERIIGIVSQNGNVYEEGLGEKWRARAEYWRNPADELRQRYKGAFSRDTVVGQYTFGIDEGSVSPDGWSLDLWYASTIPDYAEKQSDLILDYRTNVAMYPEFQRYLRENRPRLLAVWGRNDPSFVWAGAEPSCATSPMRASCPSTAATSPWRAAAGRSPTISCASSVTTRRKFNYIE